MTNEPSALMKVTAQRDDLLRVLKGLLSIRERPHCRKCQVEDENIWKEAEELIHSAGFAVHHE